MRLAKRNIPALFLFFFAALCRTEAAPSFFEGSWQMLFDSARAANKPVYVFVHDGSEGSVEMEKRLSSAKLAHFLDQNFLCYRLSADSLGELRLWCRDIPAHLFFQPDEFIVYREFGCMSPERLGNAAQRSLNYNQWQLQPYHCPDKAVPHWLNQWIAEGGDLPADSANVYRRELNHRQWQALENWALLHDWLREVDTAGFKQLVLYEDQFQLYYGLDVIRCEERLLTELAQSAGKAGDIDARLSAVLPEELVEPFSLRAKLHFYRLKQDWNHYFSTAQQLFGYYPGTHPLVYAASARTLALKQNDKMRYREALVWAEKAAKKLPDEADLQLTLAFLQAEAGKKAEADQSFSKGRQIMQERALQDEEMHARLAVHGYKAE